MVAAPLADLWRVMPSVYEELGIPLGMYEEEAFALGNQEFTPGRLGGFRLSHYLGCGSGGVTGEYADQYQVTMYIVTRLEEPAPDMTEVKTEIYATAMDRAVSGNRIHCTTTGILERKIWEAALDKLGG
jgi:hypothetical protein